MKYIVLLCDGMSDSLIEGEKTSMERANLPHMDQLAKTARIGLVRTVPDGMKPGSDVCNLSVMGYDPRACYTGRSPLEAVSMGVEMADTDVSLRCNLVTLSDAERFEDRVMEDYSGGDISTEDAAELIDDVNLHFANQEFEFHKGVSYRHCLIWHGGTTELNKMTPPHDISGRRIGEYLSDHLDAAPLLAMMERSSQFLQNHPINLRRQSEGKSPANHIWLWGQGRRPQLDSFADKYGVKGAVISAVDLLKGIGLCAGLKTPHVPGATGYIDTNFEGKTLAALEALKAGDFVYLHIEAPDECGHRGEVERKRESLELIDGRVLGPLLEGLAGCGDYRLLILPDHPTPLSTRTHSSDPVPFLLYQNSAALGPGGLFTERGAAAAGDMVTEGHSLMGQLILK